MVRLHSGAGWVFDEEGAANLRTLTRSTDPQLIDIPPPTPIHPFRVEGGGETSMSCGLRLAQALNSTPPALVELTVTPTHYGGKAQEVLPG